MDQTPRVLLVEDDLLVREGASTALRSQGYEVHAAADGTQLTTVLAEFRPHLALLDINLPDGPDGFEMASQIRNSTATPVVFITARDDLEDRLRGFDLGADDYLVKPFSMREMVARVRAVIRRAGPPNVNLLLVRDVVVDIAARTVERAGSPVSLTPTEFDLLATMASSPGVPWSKAALLEEVWGIHEHAPHLVEVQISGLRRKLEEFGPRMVVTCRNGAYAVAD